MRTHFDNGSQSIISHYIEIVGGDLASMWEVGIDVPLDHMDDFPLSDKTGGVSLPIRLFVYLFLNHLPRPTHKNVFCLFACLS